MTLALIREGAWNTALFLHVAGAMVLMGGLALSVSALVARDGSLRLGYRALLLAALPGWLAIDIDGYELWDGWILAAIVLWAIATELGRRARENPLPWHWLRTVVVVLVLVDMIWKPGA